MQTLSAAQALSLSPSTHALVDVRSPLEFDQAHIPGWRNQPILSNEHRHLVGTCYKQEGSEAAQALGHKLVCGETKEQMIQGWTQGLGKRKALVSCWRGGLRSKIATQWIEESGFDAIQVIGGYKAMRAELLRRLEACPPLVVLTGLTGSGKTKLLKRLHVQDKIDLEGLAAHRGSSFGREPLRPQPSQGSFENALALELGNRLTLVEDESRAIGKCTLPSPVFDRLKVGDLVVLETTLEERVENIWEDYVNLPTQLLGREPTCTRLVEATQRLKPRLGSARTHELVQLIQEAMGQDGIPAHQPWIQVLLKEYYDPLYQKSIDRNASRIVFRGRPEACTQYLEERLQ